MAVGRTGVAVTTLLATKLTLDEAAVVVPFTADCIVVESVASLPALAPQAASTRTLALALASRGLVINGSPLVIWCIHPRKTGSLGQPPVGGPAGLRTSWRFMTRPQLARTVSNGALWCRGLTWAVAGTSKPIDFRGDPASRRRR